MKKHIALWTLFAFSAATLLVTQIAVGRHLARRAFAEPAPATAMPELAATQAMSAVRERAEADWMVPEEPVALDSAPAANAPAVVPTVVQPPAPTAVAFDADAAKRALGSGLDTMPVCRNRGAEGKGTAEIMWTPDGQVSGVSVSAPFGDSPAGACIARRFMGARVPPFSGSPQAMRVSFRI